MCYHGNPPLWPSDAAEREEEEEEEEEDEEEANERWRGGKCMMWASVWDREQDDRWEETDGGSARVCVRGAMVRCFIN